MLDSKVVESIRFLSDVEQEEFVLFLESPFFHKGFTASELKPFYDLILECIRHPDPDPLTKELAHERVFPGKTYVESRIDRLMFEMNGRVREYLLTKHYLRAENEAQHLVDYSAIMRGKGIVSRIDKQIERLLGKGSLPKDESITSYFNRFNVVLEQHERLSMHNKLKDDVGIPEVLFNLDVFYFAQRLEMLNRYLLQQWATSLEIPPYMQTILDNKVVPEIYLEGNPVLLITTKIHELLLESPPQTEGVQRLLQLLSKHETEIHPHTLSDFFAYLRNYCAILIDIGHTEFFEILHNIQKDNLARGYYYNEGKIQPNAILNIVLMALRFGKTEWTYKFLNDHKSRIFGETETEDFYRLNLALCLFTERKYEDALDTIPFGSSYSTYHLFARRLELKIYYETQSDLLPSKIDAFKMFVSRGSKKNLSPGWAELNANFGNFVSQLSQSVPGDKKRSEQLEKRIREKKLVGERSWLIEKARELGEKKR